jgi:hypothetical protein
MVEKGGQGLDETPTSSFEEVSRLESLRPASLPVTTEPEESDNDESEDDDLGSQPTVDTNVVSDYKAAGLALYDHTRCLVELAMKVKGHPLYCGYPRQSCSRPKHRILQEIPGKTGSPGVYQQLPNTKGTVFDAVVDTLTTNAELEEQQQTNRALLEKLGASKVKKAAEDVAKTRSAPVVRIDTTPKGPRVIQVSGWARQLPQASSSLKPPPGSNGGVIPTAQPNKAAAQVPPNLVPKVGLMGPGQTNVPPKTKTLSQIAGMPNVGTTQPGGKTGTSSTAVAKGVGISTPAPSPAPALNPSAAGPAPSDPALIAILSTLVDRFDQMTAAQNQMAQTNNALLQQVTDQQTQATCQQQQLDVLQAKTKPKANASAPTTVPENVSIPSESSNANRRFYAVARGRHTGVFTR